MSEPGLSEFRPSRVKSNFNRVARDFDRALALAKLTPTQSFLMQQAREECWVKPSMRHADADPAPFRFDVHALADVYGCEASVIYRNIKGLVASAVLVRDDRGLFLINKDYRTWTVDGSKVPLLSEAQLAHAIAASNLRSETQVDRKYTHATVTKKSQFSDEIVTTSDEKVTDSDENVTNCDEKVTKSDDFVTRPIYERTRNSERERNTESKQERASVSIASLSETEAPTLTEAESVPRQIATFIVDRLSEDPGDGLSRELYETEAARWVAAGHNKPTIEAALLRSFAKVTTGLGACRYATKILNDPANQVVKAEPPKIHQPRPEPVMSPEDVADKIKRMKRWYEERLRKAEANEIRNNLPSGTFTRHVQKPAILRSLAS